MSLRLADPLGERRVAPEELPLTVGGEGARIAVPGLERDLVVGEIGIDEDGLYVEAASSVPAETEASATPTDAGPDAATVEIEPLPVAGALRLNGRVPPVRQRLQKGDLVAAGDARIYVDAEPSGATLRVVHLADNTTAAPLVEDLEAAEAVDEGATQTIARARFQRFGGAARRARAPVHWRFVVAGVAALVGLILWFFAVAVSVEVRSDPSNAEVDFLGAWPEFSVGEHHLLRSGTYTMQVSQEGFETLRRQVRVGGAADPRMTVKLVRLPGKVKFDTKGIEGLALIDDKPLGNLPGEHSVPAGKHELTVRAPRYLEYKAEIDVEGGGLPQDVAVVLKPMFSPVTIESKPAGAVVTVDEREVGVTPVTAELDAGSYTLRLAAEGFKPWETAIQVQADKPQRIGPVELGLPDGKLTVRSSPAQADVAIAGRYRGRTPIELDLAPGVEHEVVIQRAGYEPAPRRVQIKPAERLALDISLRPVLGEVTVRGEPADAVLYIAGQARGAANQTLKLPAVETALEVRKEGLETFTTSVTPQPGFPRLVEYRLLSPEQKRAARMPAVIGINNGSELRLMPTGRFQMGSPRREPGRRANESQRAVTLQRPFYIGVREVTNAEFRQFRKDHLSGVVGEKSLDLDRQPVVSVNWREAVEFCNWLSEKNGLPAAYVLNGEAMVAASPMTTGFRLPTEAEWEWAARYENGAATRRYPWGAALPVAANSGNYADTAAVELIGGAIEGYTDPFLVSAPVGSFAPNALGVYDMGGNVAEWIHDFYTSYVDLSKQTDVDSLGPASGQIHVLRGSHWRTASIAELRLAYRDGYDGRSQHVGFRVARYAE